MLVYKKHLFSQFRFQFRFTPNQEDAKKAKTQAR